MKNNNFMKSSTKPTEDQNLILIEEEEVSSVSKPVQSLRDKLKKNLNQKEKSTNNLFSGKKFTFIPYGMILSTKRISILSENIKKQGGHIIPQNEFTWNPLRCQDILIVISKEMSYEALKSLVPPIFEQDIMHLTFLDCEWIPACLQKRKCVEQSPFYVKWNDSVPESASATDHHQDSKNDTNQTIEFQNDDNNAVNWKLNPLDIKIKHPEGGVVPKVMEKVQEKDETLSLTNDQEFWQKPLEIESQDNKDSSKAYAYLYDYLHEYKQLQFVQDKSDHSSASWNQEPIQEMNIESESRQKMEEEKEFKIEPLVEFKPEAKAEYAAKIEAFIKKEHKIKRESGLKSEGATRDFTYVIDDDDDDIIYEGRTNKKLKLESIDLKGTFLEGVNDLDKINVDQSGEVVEMREFKAFNPSKHRHEKEADKNNDKPQKEEIVLCQPETKTNLNAHITDELEKLLKVYELQKDKGRVMGYGKAIAVIKAFPKMIDSVKDINSIVGIGSSMILKVKEILETGKLRKAETMQNDKRTQVLALFDDIHGVGPSTALNLYNKGLRTIEDLRRNQHLLSDIQKVGLKYYEEFKQKVPRDIVTEVVKIVEAKIEELSEYKGQFEVLCGGSYRRGRAMCGDIDIMMSPKDGKPTVGFLVRLIKSLEGNLLTDHLTWPSQDNNGGETYLGVCYYKGMHRRIDFKICQRERFGPLMIYYTGSDYFNRSMRILAANKGYHLENFGIYPAVKVQSTKYALQIIPCYSEQDVFRVLGLKYIPPEERDV